MNLAASDDVLKKIASYTTGDARSAYNVLEVAAGSSTNSGQAFSQKRREVGHPPPMTPAAREITDDIVATRCRNAFCSTTNPAKNITT